MDYLSIVLFALSGLLLLAVIVSVILLVIRNIRRGMRLQHELEDEVGRLRLGRMLIHRGIDLRRYLTGESTRTLRRHASKCRACPNPNTCDEVLSSPPGNDSHYTFCSNEKALAEIISRQSR